MRKIIGYFITLYQKWISPYKGFTCAHHHLHGNNSCSEFTKQQILKNGLFSSLKVIKKRFIECSDAAFTIRQNSIKNQRGDCDLGLSGCISCDLGGGSTGALDCLGCGGEFFSSSNKNRTRNLYILLSVILLFIIGMYFYYGRQVSSVEIRLKDGVEETTDRAIGKLFNAQLPDYRINFILKSGRKSTNTIRNISAKNWISLKSKGSFYLSDITEMTIVDKEITKSIALESFSSPSKNGKGEKFEYKIKNNWDIF